MKRLLLCVMIITLMGCSTVEYAEQPGRVEEVVLDDGRVVLQYIPGYSIEDFCEEFQHCPR